MTSYLNEARGLQETMRTDRRWLHQHPETGYTLPQTTAYVADRLRAMGYDPQEIVEGGLVATIGDTTKPCYLLRADMDALPGDEESGEEFASTNGNMHACGHDMHTAMLLGAAQILRNHEAELQGCVKLMFEPDEEACDPRDDTGAEAMIKAGLLENPTVSAASGLHLCPIGFEPGEVGYYKGTVAYSVEDVDITVTGKSTHGAQTHKGVDPINVMCHIHLALQELLAREVDPAQTVVLSFGMLQGGNAANIIPETAHMLGTLRTYDEATRMRMRDRIEQTCKGIAAAFGATAEVGFLRPNPTTHNDPELTDELVSFYAKKNPEAVTRPMSESFGGSDDFGFVANRVPATYFMLGSTPEGHEPVALHNTHIVFDEGAMPYGAALHATSAIEWLRHHAS